MGNTGRGGVRGLTAGWRHEPGRADDRSSPFASGAADSRGGLAQDVSAVGLEGSFLRAQSQQVLGCVNVDRGAGHGDSNNTISVSLQQQAGARVTAQS